MHQVKYLALALDYDGTMAYHGRVDAPTLAALERLKASGRKLLMVTGREMPDLQATFDHVGIFDLIVAENGAVLYHPGRSATQVLGRRPPPEFVEALRKRGVDPISEGQVIVAAWEPHQGTILETIRELGLELELIFNKGAIMVLPSGVNKGTGLNAAAARLKIHPDAIVGVGDGENDHSFLDVCGAFVAVANAVESLKKRADLVTREDHGAGVIDVIDRMIADDLADIAA